jgi:hypothetical protein
MTVAELIEALRDMPQGAQVVLADSGAESDPGVYRLEQAEVQCVELGWWESNGVALVEPWRNDGSMSGPYPGVVLGSLQCDPPLSIAQFVAQMSDEEVCALVLEVQRRFEGPPETPREAGIAGGMYAVSDAQMMRRIRELRRDGLPDDETLQRLAENNRHEGND